MKFSETKERVSNDLDFTTTRRLDKYITSKQTLLPKFPPRARQCIFFRGHLGLVAAPLIIYTAKREILKSEQITYSGERHVSETCTSFRPSAWNF